MNPQLQVGARSCARESHKKAAVVLWPAALIARKCLTTGSNERSRNVASQAICHMPMCNSDIRLVIGTIQNCFHFRNKNLSSALLPSLRIYQQMKCSGDWNRARARVLLRCRRGRLEVGGIHKELVCLRVKAHGLCAELGFDLSCFAEVVR